jgi:outer membrane protein
MQTIKRLVFTAGTFIFAIFFSLSAYSKPLKLSLNEAILLSVRQNPNVLSSQLNDIVSKLNVHIQEWQFHPHYSLQASTTFGPGNVKVQPGISLLTPIGTQLSVSSVNTSLSAQVMQPLMRGFGTAVVESALENAKDSEEISRLTIEGTLRSTVTSVLNAYLDVVMAEETIKISEDALKRAELSVTQTKLFIKAGHKAGNELVTVQANVASAMSQLENAKNNLAQAKYALLTAIGLDPNTDVIFQNLKVSSLINKYHLPTVSEAKASTLKNDIQYQVDNITLHGSVKRSVLVAEDNTRWQLNLAANAGNTGGSLFGGANPNQSLSLSLQIPIDDQASKQAVTNAKIALKQAELGFMQEKWNKETSAINGWNSTVSAERSLHFAEDAEKWQGKTYHVSYQKYLHGLIDSLELQSAQNQLIQSQQTLLSAQIGYIKSLVNMDMLVGNTLKTWNINVRM